MQWFFCYVILTVKTDIVNTIQLIDIQMYINFH
jgi:hypothetical protein